jgi:hypothetical protein
MAQSLKKWYDFAMLQLEQSLKAKYQVNRNLYVTCYLDGIEATADGIKAQIGIRSPGDTIVPVGTKLYLPSHTIKSVGPEGGNEYEIFYVVVLGVAIEYGEPIQICSPIQKEKRKNLRQHDRKVCQFRINFEEMESTEFTVVNGSSHGLTLLYKPSRLFIGLVLGNEYTIHTLYKEQDYTFPGQVTHIQYDWQSNQHLVGMQILQLTQTQDAMLNRMIDPNYKIEVRQTASIDTDEARIRSDM